MRFYYSKNEQQFGPLPLETLLKVIDGNTLVWNEDGSMENWQKAKEVNVLFAAMNQSKKVETKSIESPIVKQVIEPKPIDKKQLLEDYISNKLLNDFIITKKDETNFLVELEKKQGKIFKTAFNHKKHFYRLLLIIIIGITLWSVYYNFIWYKMENSDMRWRWYVDGHLTWFFTGVIPSLVYIIVWRKAYKKHLSIPPVYSNLCIRCVINNAGKAIEQEIR